jgi:ribosomal protein L37AE/L43A
MTKPNEPDATKDAAAEEARLAAEVATEHAAKAADDAAEAERELAEATKEDPKARLCPNCNAEMVKHGPENPHKAGAWHCSNCGACWQPRGSKLVPRDGHPQPTGVPAA